MSKKRSSGRRLRPTAESLGGPPQGRKPKDRRQTPTLMDYVPSPAAVRETIESVVIAFVLAFLFRTFEAEAFVIPTGSMAPTLMGRHKDLQCEVCGYAYRVSASEEVDPNTNRLTQHWVEESICPMCRYPMDLGRGKAVLNEYPSFKGDRILVGKFCYQLAEPQRWDVAVFKFPGGAQTNFIKRLTGLPNEVVWISRGDVYHCPLPDTDRTLTEEELAKLPRTIARKPPQKLLAMLQPVFDNDVMPKIAERGFPARWRPPDGSTPGGWQPAEDDPWLETDGSAAGKTWLRYEHRVPSREQWYQRENLPDRAEIPVDPQWIRDFCAYNTNWCPNDRHSSQAKTRGNHWVGDLALMCTLVLRSDSGEVVFELLEGGYQMQCRIDVATGTAALAILPEDPYGQAAQTLDAAPYRLSAQTEVRGPGRHEIVFSNVDDQLRLWVDGDVVPFGDRDAATCYLPLPNGRPLPSDRAPVGIASRGAALRIGHLRVKRDVYYRADGPGSITDDESTMNAVLEQQGQDRRESHSWDAPGQVRERVFQLGADQFLAFGDNSFKSKDSRLWGQEFYVSRRLLVGKALLIYWPHSWEKLPGTDLPFPFFPNFPRMGFVR